MEFIFLKGMLFFEEPSFHDRFLIIDDKELKLVGASLKDLGRKCFAFTPLRLNSPLFRSHVGPPISSRALAMGALTGGRGVPPL